MKKSILDKLQSLGGNIEQVTEGASMADTLMSITFDTVLYERPKDTPWAKADEEEPIQGLADFLDKHVELYKQDEDAFYKKVVDTYYSLNDDEVEYTWVVQPFTPLKEGTPDYEEWYDDFSDPSCVDITKIKTTKPNPDFLHLTYFGGWPNFTYLCLTDPNPENPTVYSTDHEVYFSKVEEEGTLDDYLDKFMAKEELIEMVKVQMKFRV